MSMKEILETPGMQAVRSIIGDEVIYRLMKMHTKPRKYIMRIENDLQIEIDNALVICKRYANPRTKKQKRELIAAQNFLATHSPSIEESEPKS